MTFVGKNIVTRVVKLNKLNLVNKTSWDGRALRMLCLRAIKNKGSHKYHRIEVVYSKNGGHSGLASVYGSWIIMRVPKPHQRYITNDDRQIRFHIRKYKQDDPSIIKIKESIKPRDVTMLFDNKIFCQVLEHELDHNLGLKHKDMGAWYNFNVDYCKDIFVAPLFKTPKPVVNHVEKRHQRALMNLKTAQTRHKRATTLLKKWERKVKYYTAKEGISL